MVSERGKAVILGVGLDNDDHEVRITRGENFRLVGGSQETHATMQEKAIKLNEKLDQRGRRLEDVSREEFVDLAHEMGMKIVPDDLPRE